MYLQTVEPAGNEGERRGTVQNLTKGVLGECLKRKLLLPRQDPRRGYQGMTVASIEDHQESEDHVEIPNNTNPVVSGSSAIGNILGVYSGKTLLLRINNHALIVAKAVWLTPLNQACMHASKQDSRSKKDWQQKQATKEE